MLRVEFVNNSNFSKILNEIIATSKYLETKDKYGTFITSYMYNNYFITSERRENGKGGIITIRIGKK